MENGKKKNFKNNIDLNKKKTLNGIIIQKLLEGNQRYIKGNNKTVSCKKLRKSLINSQSPFAIILSCADSRVVPELIFDCNIGDLFVVRVAGNIANTCSIASIEYAVINLGYKLILVLGHESCGAVTATIKGGDNGKHLNHLCSYIEESINSPSEKKSINDAVKLNAINNARNLIKNSSIIANKVKINNLKIVSGYYSLSEGTVDILNLGVY